MQLIPSLQILIAFQCLFFVFFLIAGNRLESSANKALCALLLVLGIHMGLNLLAEHSSGPWVRALMTMLGYLYGPVTYAYTRCLTHQSPNFAVRHLIHLVPAMAAFLAALTLPLSILVFAAGIFASLILYVVASWRLVLRYRTILSQTRSEFDRIALYWLSRLLVIQLILLVLNIAQVALQYAGYPSLGSIGESLLFIALLLLVNFIIYNGLQHPDLFAGVSPEDEELIRDKANDQISAQDVQETLAQVKTLLDTEQLHLNAGLTIKMVAQRLHIPVKQVSQAINQGEKINFSEFINAFRIKHAQQLLSSDDTSISILDAMLQSGFNTKSNFNRSFKQVTGLTPNAYRKTKKTN